MDDNFEVDPKIKSLVSAIGTAETGPSSPSAYTQSGASGEFGRYQFMPETYKSYAKKYLGDENADRSIGNQNKIAYSFVKEKKDAGYNPAQIASMWNAGEKKPDAYKEDYRGVNSKGVSYDTPAYVKRVTDYYHQFSGGLSDTSSTTTTSDPVQDSEPNGKNMPVTGGNVYEKAGLMLGKIFPGAKIGEALSKEFAKFITEPENYKYIDQMKGPTGAQVAGDLGQVALSLLPGIKPLQGLGVAGRLAEGGLLGTGFGATGAVAEGDTSAKDIGTSAAIGGGIGLATGGLIEAGKGIYKGISSAFTSKTADEIARMVANPATTEKEVAALSKSERAQYYKAKTFSATSDLKASVEAADQQFQKEAEDLTQEIKSKASTVGEVSNDEAEKLKEPATQLIEDMSDQYVQKTQEALTAAEESGFAKNIPHEDVAASIDSKFEHDKSGMADQIKRDLGVNPPAEKEIIDPDTGLPVINSEAPEQKTVSTETILKTAKGYIQQINKTSLGGSKVFSSNEYQLMQKYRTLMEILSDNGVEMKEANEFWKKWAPLRKTIVTQIRPFNEVGDVKAQFSRTLVSASKTANSVAQAEAKVKAQQLISAIESAMETSQNLPEGSLKGTIGKETEAAIAELEATQQKKIDAKKVAQEATRKLKKDGLDNIRNPNKPGTIAYDRFNSDQIEAKREKIHKAVIGVLKAIGITGAGYGVIKTGLLS